MITRTSRHSVVATSAGGLAFDTSVRQHTLTTDQPASAGGSDAAPTPLELLSVSLASCVALYVERFCRDRQLVSDDIAVEVNPVWRKDPGRIGRFDIILHLPDTITAEYHAELGEVARSCPVHATLSHVPEIDVRLAETAKATVAS